MLRGLKPKSTMAISVMFTSASTVYSLKVPCWRMLTSWVYCWKAWVASSSVLFCAQQHQLQLRQAGRVRAEAVTRSSAVRLSCSWKVSSCAQCVSVAAR